eukprot:172840_1
MALLEIVLCNGQHDGFVWSVDDANALRTNHRILGNFIQHLSKQNDQNKKKKISDQNLIIGLPFLLNRFEIRLCFELNIAKLIHKSIDQNTFKHQLLSPFFIENNLKRIESLKEKCKYAQNKTRIESSRIGQKRKLTETDIIDTKEHKSKWYTYDEVKIKTTANIIHHASDSHKSLDKRIPIAPSQNDFVLFPNELFNTYVFKNMNDEYDPSIFWSKLFNFDAAQTEIYQEQYTIFGDLYDKGFYILMDRRFSGHFILYQRSPSLSVKQKVHSQYIVQIISKYDTNYKSMKRVLDKYCKQTLECDAQHLLELDMMIMCFVRVAVNVKKHMLFSYIDSDTNGVKYYIVKWHYSKAEMNTDKEMWYQVYRDYKPSIGSK